MSDHKSNDIFEDITHNKDNVIKLENVFYSYDKNKALKGINMCVDRGTIYGLIGASGCGKTTALRIIIGLLKPSSGSITVFSNTTGTSSSLIPGPGVGYMPQELALYPFLTIKEILYFYAQLNDVDSDLRNERINYLIKLLNLPKDNQLTSTLSGGQKRRVSLAATLIHEPPLLILDEPTVGVDPILRRNIWDYLRNICLKHKQTIIITTHYHEEAKLSDCVGLMRNGRLLIEESPMEILTQMNLNSIEDVFFKLCLDDDSKSPNTKVRANLLNNNCAKTSETKIIIQCPSLTEANEVRVKFRSNSIIESTLKGKDKSFKKISSFIWKNSFNYKRNIPMLLTQFVIPIIKVIFSASLIGRHPRDITIAVYDPDSSLGSRYVINHIDTESINLIYYNSLTNAIDSVKGGHSWAVISFPTNFTTVLKDIRKSTTCECDDETKRNRKSHPYEYLTKDAKQIPQIEIFMDDSNSIISNFVKSKINDAIKYAAIDSNEIFGSEETSLRVSSIKLSEPSIYGKENTEITSFIIPGLMLMVIFFTGVSSTALSLFSERKDSILERSLSAGVKPYQIILSVMCMQIPILVLQIVFVIIASFICFNIPQNGSWLLIHMICFIHGLCGMSFGLFISSICKTEIEGMKFYSAMMMPVIVLSGLLWPQQALPKFLSYISYLLPQNFAGEAIRSIISRGWDLSYFPVQLGFIIQIIWIILFVKSASYFFNHVL